MVDVIVVGAGVAGMTAALNCLRNGMSVTVLEEDTFGGQIALSPRVENFPTVMASKGSDLADSLFNQITEHGATVELEKVLKVEKNGKIFTVTTDYNCYSCRAVIIAAGVKHRHLKIESESQLIGHGVSYCALCDGAFYKGEEVALIGDANSALQYALLLSEYCPKVHMFTLFDRFFGDEVLIKAVNARKNIVVTNNCNVVDFRQSNGELIGFDYIKDGKEKLTFDVKAVFVAIGQVPDNKKFAELVQLDKEGFIEAGEECLTSCEGVFAAGDCRTKKVRQLTTAAADGAVAAFNACNYILANN